MANFVPVRMTSQRSADKDELLVCPYDPVHRISAKRFLPHLLKCKQNFPNVQLETCPFNARHKLRKPEMRHHISSCPDRYFLELNHQSQSNRNSTPAVALHTNQEYDFDDDESWDGEILQRKQRSLLADSDRGDPFHGARTMKARAAAVEKIKVELQEQRRRASDAQELPSRRPIYSWGGKVSMAMGALNDRTRSTNVQASNSVPRARLAPNFSFSQNETSSTGRGRLLDKDRSNQA